MQFSRPFVKMTALAAAIASAGMGRESAEVLGPELSEGFAGTWAVVSGTGVTVDGTGIHFVNAANVATVGLENAPIVNDARYKISVTIANVGAPNNGTCQVLCYGTSNNHVGQFNVPTLAAGTYVGYVNTIATATATLTAIRVRCSGTSGNNNFDVTAVSVKRVLS